MTRHRLGASAPPLVLAAVLLAASAAQAQPVEVGKRYDKPVLVHYMPWHDTPAFGGSWGYHWTFGTQDPNTIVHGEREIASHYYPLIGPYGSRDPDVIEYHLLLMKYAGIDGVIVDWYGERGSNGDVGSLLRNANALIDRTDEAGLDFALILEDRFTESVAQARANVAYAGENYLARANYVRLGGAPLVGVFGPITFQSPAEWSDILSGAGREVTFLPLWYEADDAGAEADGEYLWVYEDENLDDYDTRLETYYRDRAPYQRWVMGVAYPGFDDFYAEGGVGASYFDIPHEGTGTLRRTLDLARRFDGNVDALQLVTWNDFGEGTMFEPTREFGFAFLTELQDFLGVEYGERELREVLRLYDLRKRHAGDSARQGLLDEAYGHFVALRVERAVATLDAVAEDADPSTPSAGAATASPGGRRATAR